MKKTLLLPRCIFVILLVSLIVSCTKDSNHKTDISKEEAVGLEVTEFIKSISVEGESIIDITTILEEDIVSIDDVYCVYKITKIVSDECDDDVKVDGKICRICSDPDDCKKSLLMTLNDSDGVFKCKFYIKVLDTDCIECPEGGIKTEPS